MPDTPYSGTAEYRDLASRGYYVEAGVLVRASQWASAKIEMLQIGGGFLEYECIVLRGRRSCDRICVLHLDYTYLWIQLYRICDMVVANRDFADYGPKTRRNLKAEVAIDRPVRRWHVGQCICCLKRHWRHLERVASFVSCRSGLAYTFVLVLVARAIFRLS